MSDNTQNEAIRAMLALVGQDPGDVEHTLYRYGAAAATPDVRVVTKLIRETCKDDCVDRYRYEVIRERGKDLVLVVLVVQEITYHYDAPRRADGEHARIAWITVGVGLAPKSGGITPGRAWRDLSPWHSNLRNYLGAWASRSRDDRVRFDRKYLDHMLAALEGADGRGDCE